MLLFDVDECKDPMRFSTPMKLSGFPENFTRQISHIEK